jgi:uncharacterized damage-inducible protein DinB
MSPEQTAKKMSVGATLAAELQREAISTRKMLERVPAEAFDWTPHEKSMPLGHLAQHLVRLVSFVKPTLTTDEYDLASGEFESPTLTNAEELVARFDENLSEAIDYLSRVADEELTKTWRLRAGEKTIFEMSRAAVIRTLVLSHLIHHRGQFSVYLRLRGVPVPSVYGPSADEQ